MLIYEKVGEMGSLANQKHCGHQLSPVVIKPSQLPLRQNEKLKINFLFFTLPRQGTKWLYCQVNFPNYFRTLCFITRKDWTKKAIGSKSVYSHSFLLSYNNRFFMFCHTANPKVTSQTFVWQVVCIRGKIGKQALKYYSHSHKSHPN